MDIVLEDLRKFISYRVREGFDSVHDIIANATDYAYETYGRDDLQPQIKLIASDLVTSHRAKQSEWESTTDCDRLGEAFATLNRRGIVARQDFSCCNNCGFTDIWDEIEIEEKQQKVDGYVFYHLQCTERAVNSGQLLMAFGCVEENPEIFQKVARMVVEELNRVGLNASWLGTEWDPIVVEGIVWRRGR